jgi:hypothetical protein
MGALLNVGDQTAMDGLSDWSRIHSSRVHHAERSMK